MRSPHPFVRLTIIGTGLIGSSIAHAVKAFGGAEEVVLYDAAPQVRTRAARLVPGRVCDTLAQAVTGADCIILCTPVGNL